jgi:predicted phage tail protein
MKKVLLLMVMVLLFLGLVSPVLAVGPYMKDPHTAAWDANTESDLAGYNLYWRVTGTAWDDARRVAVAKSASPTFNLLNVITANGNYEIMVTAIDSAGNESGPSNIVPFVVDLPGAPRNNRVQAP